MAVDYAGPRRARARARRVEAGAQAFARNFDWLLFGAVAALVGYGLHLVAGITRDDVPGSPDYYVVRQAIYAAVGSVAMAGVSLLDPDVFRRYWRQLYAVCLLLLLLVIPLGNEARGSQRWLGVGSFSFQPSELGKLLVILAVGGFLAERARRIGEIRIVLGAIGLTAVPTVLVFAQPDIGTSLVYGAALAAMLFVAGTRWLHVTALLTTIAVAAGLVVSRSVRRLMRSTMNADNATTRSSLPSSEGWKLKNGSEIARFDPRAETPKAYTSRIEAIRNEYTPSFHSRRRE